MFIDLFRDIYLTTYHKSSIRDTKMKAGSGPQRTYSVCGGVETGMQISKDNKMLQVL
jgi:hypothetical protein